MAIKVDLLPTERTKFGFDAVIAIVILLIVLTVVGCVVYSNNLTAKIAATQSQLAQIQSKIDEANKVVDDVNKYTSENDRLRKQIKMVETLKYDPVRYSNLLDSLTVLLPNNMWITSVSIEPNKRVMVISGVAVEQPGVRPLESISGFMKSVNKFKYFTGATISKTTRGTTTVGKVAYTSYGWTIDMGYDPDAAENMVSSSAAATDNSSQKTKNDGNGRS